MTEDPDPCLLVVLKEELALAITPQCPNDTFVYNNICYEDQGYGDFTGFYDWLRNSEERVIGVRYLPVDELEFLQAAVKHLPYVLIDSNINSIEIYFTDNRGVEESISDDQDFGNNRVFRSDAGGFALSFNADRAINSFSAEVASKCRQLE